MSRATNSAKPPQPQPISSTVMPGLMIHHPGQGGVFLALGGLKRFAHRD